jgi:hypothetical protein
MKISLLPHTLAFGLALALGGAPALRAQDALPVQESVFAAGVTASANGQAWAYLLWQSNAPDLLEARSYSVWEKPGLPATPGNYTRRAVVGLQTDPLAISALIERAVLALGENPVLFESTVTNLFEDLATGPITLPDKVSAVIRGALAEPRFVENLLLAARRHPALNLALGQAVALPIAASGASTFEIREHDPVRNADLGVIGRITVNHAAPVTLPPPTALTVAPKNPQDGFNNLNIKLRWDTPPNLRRVQLLTQGFNLYRVNKAFAEAQFPAWPGSPPPAAQLALLAEIPGSGVARVNSAPITPNRLLDAAEVGAADHTVSFFTDEETRFPGYPATHTPPQNGDQYYYFVTVRDLLGRDLHSGSSPGALGTFCDVMPPAIPSGRRVTNEFTFAGGAEKQILRLHWKHNDNSGEKKTTGYFIYRWSRSDEVYQLGGNPVTKLVAGPIWPGPGQVDMTWDDPGPYTAATGLTYDNTVWYTIRSSDDGSLSPPGAVSCLDPVFGNLSGHSPPLPGVLRDRVGPAAPEAVVLTWCLLPRIQSDRFNSMRDDNFDRDYYEFRLIANRSARQADIVAVDFRFIDGEQVVELGRSHFAPNAERLQRSFRRIRLDGKQGWNFQARAVTSQGVVSNWESNSVGESPGVGEITEVYWKAFAEYERVAYTERGSNFGTDCRTHVIPPAGSLPPGESPFPEVVFNPPVGTKQYKLYYRIDNGPLTLGHEDGGDFDPLVAISVAAKVLTAAASEVCLFLQVFDVNGNPSRMTRLVCFPIGGSQPLPKPMLAPIQPGLDGIVPQAKIRWFCPPQGVDRFRVWISSTPTPVAATSSPLLYATTPGQHTVSEDMGGGVMQDFTYSSFDSELIGPLFGNGASFALDANVMLGSKIRVKVAAVTASGTVGPWSNVEEFEWKPEAGLTGPDVPWPARTLPGFGAAGDFSAGLAPLYLYSRGTVGVRIGHAISRATVIFGNKEQRTFRLESPQLIDTWLFKATFEAPELERSVLPAALYRTQVPNDLYPDVPGDVVQVSPLMEKIVGESIPPQYFVYDPFIHIEPSIFNQSNNDIFLLDTQPQVVGATYVYLLVLFDPASKEIFKVIPVNSVTIP